MKKVSRRLIIFALLLIVIAGAGVWVNSYVEFRYRVIILSEKLRVMRKALDQYAFDNRRLPSSLDDLRESAGNN